MRKLFTIITFLIFCYSSFAQREIIVETGNKSMSKGEQMAVTVLIPESQIKDAEPIWKKYVNNRSVAERFSNLTTSVGNIFKKGDNKTDRDKLKVEKIGDEWYVRAIDEPSISNYKLDIYARATNLSDACLFHGFFQFTDSIFINESNIDDERLYNMKMFMHNFGIEVYKSVVDKQIKEAKKILSKEERIGKKLESSIRKYEKSISGYEVDIEEYETEIRGVENDIIRINEINEEKKTAFSSISKGTPDYDLAKVELKAISKEKSKSFGKIKSLKGKIKSKQMDIKSAKNKIVKNETQFSIQEKIVEEKQLIVEDLEMKKENIK